MSTPDSAAALPSANCPAEQLLRLLAGKWKPQLFRLALQGPLRFSALLRQLEGVNKQSLATALRELEEEDVLRREVLQLKPLHVEYRLTERGLALVPVLRQLELLA